MMGMALSLQAAVLSIPAAPAQHFGGGFTVKLKQCVVFCTSLQRDLGGRRAGTVLQYCTLPHASISTHAPLCICTAA